MHNFSPQSFRYFLLVVQEFLNGNKEVLLQPEAMDSENLRLLTFATAFWMIETVSNFASSGFYYTYFNCDGKTIIADES